MIARFQHLITFDFEYATPPGLHPEPRTLVALDLNSGAERRLWLQGCPPPPLPFPHGQQRAVDWLLHHG
jgi:hypothetical protein